CSAFALTGRITDVSFFGLGLSSLYSTETSILRMRATRSIRWICSFFVVDIKESGDGLWMITCVQPTFLMKSMSRGTPMKVSGGGCSLAMDNIPETRAVTSANAHLHWLRRFIATPHRIKTYLGTPWNILRRTTKLSSGCRLSEL